MDNDTKKQQDSSSQSEDHQVAVPYIPPPPPEESRQKNFRSPLVNGSIFAGIILLVGFMSYNYAGHQLTRLSSASVENSISPTPSVEPTATPTP